MSRAGEQSVVAHVVPHTHWDREWYWPFEAFRGRLVEVIDSVLELLQADDRYRGFMLDGQTVLLEDYLEIRPERQWTIAELVAAGKLEIGPWYVLADEFLVSPESLIRNLAVGTDLCEKFGRRVNVAYTPDSFGHISQLPLVARGFGLDSIVFERGVGDEGEELGAEFSWECADGSDRVFAVHLLQTYSGAAGAGHDDWEYRDEYSAERARRHMQAVLYGADGVELGDMPLWLRESIERIRGGALAYVRSGSVLLLNGSDHLFPQANLPELIEDMNAAFDSVVFRHATLTEYVDLARTYAHQPPVHRGEFRGSRYHHVLPGVLSTRMYLKQANNRLESRVERVSEPLAAAAWLLSATETPARLVSAAATRLLQNHPHDSICGCSVDEVHRQMMHRNAVVTDALDYAEQRAIDQLSGAHGCDRVIVFNPLPVATTHPVTVELTLPYGAGRKLRLRDECGNAAPCVTNVSAIHEPGRSDRYVDRVEATIVAPLRPAGFTSFSVDPSGENRRGDERDAASGAAGGNSAGSAADGDGPICASERSDGTVVLTGSRIEASIAADGTITISDREGGRTLETRPYFEDVADGGDEYDFSSVDGDAPIRIEAPYSVTLVTANAAEATAKLIYRAAIPERLTDTRDRRTGSVALNISLYLTVRPGSPSLGMKVAFENRASDHRMRIGVPTGRRSDEAVAEGHFDVLRRPITERMPHRDWFQKPQPTSHNRRFVLAHDGEAGVALLNRGLPEYEARAGERGVDLLVTLLRSVGWLSRHDLCSRPQSAGPNIETPDAQCLGEHTFELALYPFTGGWDESELTVEADRLNCPPVAFLSGAVAQALSLISVSPPVCLSTVRKARERDGVIVRVWNPADRAVTADLATGFDLDAVRETRLDEQITGEVVHDGRRIALEMAPKAVRTLELVPAGGVRRAGDTSAAIEYSFYDRSNPALPE